MIHTRKIYCEWVNLGKVVESKSLGRNCMISVIDRVESFTSGGTNDFELGIFLDKADNDKEYEVLVIKSKKSDRYTPLEIDKFKRVTENDKTISFFFYTFDEAIKFADSTLPLHNEFQDRPIKLI